MTTNKPHDPVLRAAIIAEMKRKKAEDGDRWRDDSWSSKWFESCWMYCTWWFKFEIRQPTAIIRRELERMERDGLVTADRSQSNNTKWKLVEVADDNQ